MSKPTREVSDSDSSSALRWASPTLWRWIALAALLIAVAATVIAVVALFRPPQPAAGAAGAEKSTEEAKTSACDAFATVRRSVSVRTNVDLGADPVAAETVAANARLAMAVGGSYLLEHLDPATPSPLADEVRSFAHNLQDIAMYSLAGMPNDNPAQAARLRDGEQADQRIAEMCR